MRTVDADDVDGWAGPAAVKRPLGRALDASDVAVNYYELAPGDSFAFGYHRHADQEEVFVVLDGVATFETADGAVAVEAGEAVRFAPGEWQRGVNEGEEHVRALAIGAPADTNEAELRRQCETCGDRRRTSIERAPEGAEASLVTVCEDCGATTGRFS